MKSSNGTPGGGDLSRSYTREFIREFNSAIDSFVREFNVCAGILRS
jgi:hypothetical protein